jgi:hypothetical protein
MTPCVTFFKATIDMLWSLVGTAMTIVASLFLQPSGYANGDTPSPAVMLASFESAADLSDLIARLGAAEPGARVIAACELERLGSDARAAIPALVDRLSDASPVDPQVCGKDRHYRSKDLELQTTPGEMGGAPQRRVGVRCTRRSTRHRTGADGAGRPRASGQTGGGMGTWCPRCERRSTRIDRRAQR